MRSGEFSNMTVVAPLRKTTFSILSLQEDFAKRKFLFSGGKVQNLTCSPEPAAAPSHDDVSAAVQGQKT